MRRARLHRLLAFTLVTAVGVSALQTNVARVCLVVGLALVCAVGWPTRRKVFGAPFWPGPPEPRHYMDLSNEAKPHRLPYTPPTVVELCGTTKAPPGWWCSRKMLHDGPCAARPIGTRL